MKHIKKKYKLILGAISFIFIILITSISILYSSTFQTWAAQKLSAYYSSKLETNIYIEKLQFTLFSSFSLQNLLIKDKNNDSLLYAKELIINLSLLNFRNKKINISKIYIAQPKININFDSLGIANYQFILDEFLSTDTSEIATKTVPDKYLLVCKSFIIKHANLLFINNTDSLKKHPSPTLFNTNFIKISDLNLSLKNIKVSNNESSFQVSDFSAKEKYGLKIKKFHTFASIQKNEILLTNFLFQTEKSKISLSKIKLLDYADSLANQQKISVRIDDNTKIASSELALFDTIFQNTTENIYISGAIFGSKKRLIAQNLRISTSIFTEITLNAGIIDATKPEMQYYLHIKDFKTTKNDIIRNTLNKHNFEEFIFPKTLPGLNAISFSTKIYGNKTSASGFGKIRTNTGDINFSGNYSQDSLQNKLEISGNIETENFDLLKLTNIKKTGKISISLQTKFNFVKNKISSANSTCKIKSVDYSGYTFKNINCQTNYLQKNITAQINIRDKNLVFNGSSSFNFKNKKPVFSTKSNLNFANLDLLLNDTTMASTTLSGEINGKIAATNIDDIDGDIRIHNASVLTETEYIPLKRLHLFTNYNDNKKTITLKSDYIDAKLFGNIKLSNIKPIFTNMLRKYLPDIIEKSDSSLQDGKISLNANFKNLDKINRNFFPKVHISNGSNIFFELSKQKSASFFSLKVNIPKVIADNNTFSDFRLSASTQDMNLSADIDCKANFQKNAFILDAIIVRTSINNNKINSLISWQNKNTSSVYAGSINPVSLVSIEDSNIVVKTIFEPTELTIANYVWQMKGKSVIYKKNKVEISDIYLQNNKQLLWLNGTISTNPDDFLTIDISNFELIKLNEFLNNPQFIIAGKVNATITASSLLTQPKVNVTGAFIDFSANKIPFGEVSFSMTKGIKSETLAIEISALKLRNRFYLKGFMTKNNELFMNLSLEYLDLKVAAPFLGAGISINNGYLTGDCAIGGDLQNPQWNGFFALNNANIGVDYLGTNFAINSDIEIGSKKLKISDTYIFDQDGNLATFSANINHHNFKNLLFDINFDTNKFMVLNTNETTHETYFGKLYAAGFANISGTPEKLMIDAELSTLKNSHLTLITENTEINENTKIFTFVSDSTKNIQKKNNSLSGISMNFHLKISDQTSFKIIIDEFTNNFLTASGNGDIDFKANYLGNISLSGSYIINKGLYHFSAGKLYTMNFYIKKGSSIKWNGSPENAQTDIVTYLKIKKADVFPLMYDQRDKDKKLPARCNINISENIMSPKINFGVSLEKEDARISSILKALSAEQLNKQFLSLLTMQKFTPLPGITKNVSEASGINAAEILSGQLGSVISMFSDNIDIGINYKQGQTGHDEYGVDFSTQFLNDRITINGNISKSNSTNYSTDIIGDFDAEVKLSADGKFKMKAFNKTNKTSIYSAGPYTQGLGFFYKKEFNSLFYNQPKNIFEQKDTTSTSTKK